MNGWFLGDNWCPFRPNLLTPILSPETLCVRGYTSVFLKSVNECVFGLWKSRWRSMGMTGGSLCFCPKRVGRQLVAAMALHNICIQHGFAIGNGIEEG
ncbi:Nuclease HARBI1 [Oopsacas minuta]|uniref:Nuclease HARBI1 n=1 Tax=Oopsacas minuta TaxID=111878 RepID=A0AAV7JSR0_9METZ|nr:Nuclease HARBI1 [Oopsacas minuta]